MSHRIAYLNHLGKPEDLPINSWTSGTKLEDDPYKKYIYKADNIISWDTLIINKLTEEEFLKLAESLAFISTLKRKLFKSYQNTTILEFIKLFPRES